MKEGYHNISTRRLPSKVWVGYVMAVAGTSLAGLLRWKLGQVIGEQLSPYTLFYPVVMVSALLGGVYAGLLATLLAAGTVDYLFLPPTGFEIKSLADITGCALFVIVNSLISVGGGALRSSRLRTEQKASELAETVGLLDLGIAFLRDANDRIIRWSAGCQRFYGFTSQEAVGAVSHELLHTRFPEPLAQIRATLLETGRWSGELGHTTADGREMVVKTQWEAYRNQAGQLTAILEHSSDITRRKQAEELLRKSEERFRTLAEVSTQVVWVSNPAGQPLEDSPSWRAFAGRSLELGEGCKWQEAIHPDDRCAAAETWRVAMGGVQPYSDEFRLLHASGVYRDVSARAVPVLRADGTPREWIATLTDITVAKRSEAARNTLLAIIADSNDAIISKTLDGIVTSWNRGAERIFGFSAEEMLGNSITRVIPPDLQDEEPRILAEIGHGGTIEHYESQRLTKDGRLIDVSITASPIYDTAGVIVGVSKIARDITESKKAEEALRQVSHELACMNAELEQKVQDRTAELRNNIAELEHFSYSITHDMRAPLRAMRSYISLLTKDSNESFEPRVKSCLAQISSAAERMDHLIVDALDFSKTIRERMPLRVVDTEALLRGVIESYPAFQSPAADIRVEGSIPKLLANEAGLTQCFSNLLNNAVKFVFPNQVPQIRIWAESSSSSVRLWFVDNGIGIPKEAQKRIFDMFQRVHREYQGTGIGLALVLKVVERMGGRVGVESEPGKGSRFWLELRPGSDSEGGMP